MRAWWARRKGKAVAALVSALTVAILTGWLKLPPQVAQPVAAALATAAQNMVEDSGSDGAREAAPAAGGDEAKP